MDWMSLFYVAIGALLIWLAVRIIRRNPESFSKANLGKSVYTIGWLTLLIIAVVALGAFFLKH